MQRAFALFSWSPLKTLGLAGGMVAVALVLALVLLPFLSQAENTPHPEEAKTFTVGVLAFRSLEQTQQRWQPLIDHLNQQIPQHSFQLKPLYYNHFTHAFKENSLDFVFTNPQHYILLQRQQPLHPLATLMPLAENQPVSQFGGVIFTRADREDINRIEDLRRQRIAATLDQSFGGFLMQKWEAHKRQTPLTDVVYTGMPHDLVVIKVLSGQADVGFVRTGVLESLVKTGDLRWQDIKVINPIDSHFPQVHSTELYPEWPFAVMSNVNSELQHQIALALFNITADSAAAQAGDFFGFSPPRNYSQTEALMLRLDVIARDDFSWQDIIKRYPLSSLASISGFVLLLGLALLFVLLNNRRLKKLYFERDQLNQDLKHVNQNLEQLVDQRSAALQESEQRFYQMFANHASPMLLISPTNGAILDANKAAAEFYGYSIEHLKAMNIHQINTLPKEQVAAERERAYHEKRNYFIFPHRLASGEVRQVEVHSSPIVINDETCLFSIIHDITQRIKTEATLKLHNTALDHAANAVAITDQQGKIIWANKAYHSLTGYSPEEVVGKSLYHPDDAHPDDKALYQHIQQVVRQGEVWHGILEQERKNGDRYVEEATITPVRDEDQNLHNFVAVLQDITERKQAEQQIQSLAFFDPLTQLPNRRLLIDRLESVMAQTTRSKQHAALLFLDLDNFKVLNDSHGHQLGDKMLIEAAQRIKNCVRMGDTVARFGGDEFVVLLSGLDTEVVKAAQQARAAAEKIRAHLSEIYILEGVEPGTTVQHYSSASIGVSLFKDHEKSLDDLLKWTDMAMYQAKASGRNEVRLFDPEMQNELDQRAQLEQDLRQAVELGQLELHYQPQVDSRHRILGAEALLRWHHPQQGMISPGVFIPLAEESGLILQLGDWVLESACQQLGEWKHHPQLCLVQLSINVSAKQLRQLDFVDKVKELVRRYDINPLMLKLELTESVLMSQMDDSVAKMRALRLLGIQFSIDDFGTGYSSLAYLKSLPLNQIKIDQSFIRDLSEDEMDAVMVQAIMTLGENFQMSVIAEGVESLQQFERLRSYRCEFFQGYLFSKPVPLQDFKDAVQNGLNITKNQDKSLSA